MSRFESTCVRGGGGNEAEFWARREFDPGSGIWFWDLNKEEVGNDARKFRSSWDPNPVPIWDPRPLEDGRAGNPEPELEALKLKNIYYDNIWYKKNKSN